MRLYAGTSEQFIQDAIQNQIAEKLKLAFFNYFRYYPSPMEVNSWKNSLRAVSQVFQYANLLDHGVILEYQLPLTSKRLDCLICGKKRNGEDNAVIIELKQWDKCKDSTSDNEVLTWVGGANREVLHPSVQVGQYQIYLADTHTAFNAESNPVGLQACSYLHNYNYYSEDVLFSDKFKEAIHKWPIFTADDVEKLKNYLQTALEAGKGLDVLKRVEESKYRPSKKLMEHVGNIIKNKSEYILLDEQLIVYDKVFSTAKESFHNKQKAIILIKGGPGTGKSVIAINLLADLSLKNYNTHYATGSKTFTETLRKIIGRRGAAQFKYFNSYSEAQDNEIDILVADEAHRIRETSNNRFTPKAKRKDLPQIEELIRVAKVCVFFIDDFQIVRPGEIGSTEYIKAYAEKMKCKYFEYELETQFRCNGSEAFINWINNTLGIKRTANVIWDLHEEFDFKIFDTPEALRDAIRLKNADKPNSGRLVTGFCWPWSDPRPDGSLVDDVVIGNFKMPWEKKDKFWEWATENSGMNQVGTVYTAQGFEFDYIGVIFGPDLTYNFDFQKWIGNPEKSSDGMVTRAKAKFTDMVKNVYRVLMSRGMKGCYVHFMDKDTERFFRSRVEVIKQKESLVDVRNLLSNSEVEESKKYVTYLPVYSLQAAASAFSEEQSVECLGWKKVQDPSYINKDCFVARVVGKSMEPTIPDGSYCIFRRDKGGTRNGLVVLVESNRINDPENGQQYTVKRYQSEKEFNNDGTWAHKKIILSPDNKEYRDIILEKIYPSDFKVIAEFVSLI